MEIVNCDGIAVAVETRNPALAARFFELFRGSDRTHGIYRLRPIDPPKPGEKCEGQALTVPGAATVDLWQRHLDGACGLGIVPATADGTCHWGAVDVDDYGLDLPAVARKVKAAGLPLIVCRTKSGGAHLYLFLAEPAPSSLVRRKLQEWASALGWGASEIFPKQDAVDGDNAGSWVNMPYHAGDRSLRYAIDPDTGTALDASEFLDLTYDAAVTPEALAEWPIVAPPDVTTAQAPGRPSEPEWAPDPTVPDDADYPGHPPCLAAILRAGVRDGTRNEVLFNLALTYKKENAATAEARAMEAARSFDPPMAEREARATIRSALKRPYHYRCRNAPLKSHCDRTTCLTRRLGVRNSERRTTTDAQPILNPGAPRDSARQFVRRRKLPLICHGGDLYEWRRSYYHQLSADDVRADLYAFLDGARRPGKAPGASLPFDPNSDKVKNVHDALKALVHLPSERAPPCWVGGGEEAGPIMPCRNGLLRIADGALLPHSADYFNTAAADFDYDPAAPQPAEWLRFLASLWPDDIESINTLQEMIGYILSGDGGHHKMFLLIGPTRSGKGTIGRILVKLLGGRGHVGVPLANLAGTFGLQPLLGKMLALVPDARLSGRSHTIVERLLAISGQDDLTVERKNTTSITVRLPARFVFLTNVLPALADPSGTVAKRFIVLTMMNSFFGRSPS